MPLALYALTAGAFGIGVTEFVIMGLLLDVSADLGVTLSSAGLLISGYALGVVVGAPVLTVLTARWPRKAVLLGLMGVFTLGNAACALAPDYATLMAARVLTAFAHATFFGVGSVVATGLVAPNKKASAIALLVPNTKGEEAPSSLKHDLAVLTRAPLLLGLATTVLSWVGVFAAFTYIAPMLTRITGFSEGAVSPILLVFGGGLVVGNLLGGRLADWRLVPTVFATLLALSVVLVLLTFALHSQIAAVAFVGLLGAVAFATVAPLQMWVLEKAQGAGQSLASSFNIAAFNLGNAIGAWLGGLVIDHGPGLGAIPWIAALVPLAAMGTALWAVRLEAARGRRAEPAAAA